MDLAPYAPWLRLLHVAGAFAFVAGHGVSMLVAFRLRHEREPARMLALLDLSGASLGLAGIGLLVMLVSGIIAGIVGGYFGQAWTWASLVLLVAVTLVMTPIASHHFTALRHGLGQRTRASKATDADPVPLPVEEVLVLARRPAPEQALVVGAGGFVVILWLMTFKPF